jgi:hypothetical protein
MEIEKKFIFFIAFFVSISIMYLFVKDINLSNGVTTEVQASEDMRQPTSLSFIAKSTGSLESGDTVIELKPEVISDGKLELKFSINTHSVNLGKIDLNELTTLEYNNKTLHPVKASRIGSHHSSGTIIFDTDEDIESFTVKINGIPNIKERIYKWNVG